MISRRRYKAILRSITAVIAVVAISGVLYINNNHKTEAATTSFSFGTGGDHGNHSESQAVFQAAANSGVNFFQTNGDLSYGETSTQAFCDMVKSKLGTIPFVTLNGNHEEPSHVTGSYVNGDDIDVVIQPNCLPRPTELNITDSPYLTGNTGTAPWNYGREYYYDYPVGNPTARIIAASADVNTFVGGLYDYSANAGPSHYNWLQTKIQEAKQAGLWVIVVNHTPYMNTGGSHGSTDYSSTTKDFFNLLLQEKVDLILSGHDHNYQRTKQIGGAGCAYSYNVYNAGCVVNANSTGYTAGKGSVMVITGTAGGNKKDSPNALMNPIDTGDPDYPYFASTMGLGSPNMTFGFSKFDITSTSITGSFVPGVGQTGGFTDTFTITKAVPDNANPTVTWKAPTPDSTISGSTTLAINATDDVAIQDTAFYGGPASDLTGAVLLGPGVYNASTGNYEVSVDTTKLTDGNFYVVADARDTSDKVTRSSTYRFTVNNTGTPPADTTLPTVSLTAPANNATVSGNVSLTATASDNSGTVSKVEFYQGTTKLGESTTSPYSFSWNTTAVANGSYTLTAKAYDPSNNVGTSTAVTVTVNNTTGTAPVKQFTMPVVDSAATATISAAGVCENITSHSAASQDVVPAGQGLLLGASFSLSCTSVGGDATITIDLGSIRDKSKLRVYKLVGTTLKDITADATITTSSVSTSIAYSVVDGGNGDEDGIANSVIIDPVYVTSVLGTSTTDPTSTLSDTGSSIFLLAAGAFGAIIVGSVSLVAYKRNR